jgi:quercetin dioxygenase-like cupin family protein
VAKATGGRVFAQLAKANAAPEKGTGWHAHQADFHIGFMTRGWEKFMYEGKKHIVEAGDCVHQRRGIAHFLFDYSPDMEYLEIVSPAEFGSTDAEKPCPVPASAPWPAP